MLHEISLLVGSLVQLTVKKDIFFAYILFNKTNTPYSLLFIEVFPAVRAKNFNRSVDTLCPRG